MTFLGDFGCKVSGDCLGRELQGGSECDCCYKGPDNMLHRYPGAVYPICEVIFI